MFETADVTIAIPVYNGERYLAQAVSSALQQTVTVREVLIFDNASTDRTVEIAHTLLPPHAIHSADINAGAIANFNKAVAEASGEWFLWLAADDRLLPHHVERCLQVLRQMPEAPACLPGIRYIDEAGIPQRKQRDTALSSERPRVRLRSFLRRSRWTEVYCLYRRDALLASPRFTAEYGPDVLLTWWFLLRGPLVVVEEPLLEYREYASKTVEEMAETGLPGQDAVYWRKVRLWRRLWALSTDTSLDRRTRRVARQELILCVVSRTGIDHLLEDVGLRLTHAEAGSSAKDSVTAALLRAANHLLRSLRQLGRLVRRLSR
jgi:glycosyltransferase involved in cell wall biosynthesis